jgi:YD repeat-containing protein
MADRTAVQARDGSVMGYSHDALNRMSVKTVPERADLAASQTRDVYYGYDLRGLQLYARFDSASGEGLSNAWDGFGRLAAATSDLGGAARTLTYQYDADGDRVRITHPDGHYFRTSFDGLDRPVYLWEDGALYAAIGHYYASHGALVGLVRPGAYSWRVFDGVGRLASVSDDLAGSAADRSTLHGYNPAGQLVSLTRNNDAYAWGGHYAASRAYAVNGLNQYTAAGGASFAYDANGNLASDGGNVFTYDVENRLVTASGAHHASLAYDPLGRLWQVTDTATGAVTRFLYDGDALVAEYDGSGAMLRRHVHGAGADVPLIDYEGATLSTPRFPFADERGSIVALTDGSGAAVAINAYDEYGIPAAGNQAGSSTRAKHGSPSSASITTRPGSTRPRSAGSCRPIRLDMRISSTFTLMSEVILLIGAIRAVKDSSGYFKTAEPRANATWQWDI